MQFEWDPAKADSNLRKHGEGTMKKDNERDKQDELRPEYDLSRMKDAVRGKYAKRFRDGTNLVLLTP